MNPTTGGWRKSSFSGASNDCVEVAPRDGSWAVRDSKAPAAGTLAFRLAALTALVRSSR